MSKTNLKNEREGDKEQLILEAARCVFTRKGYSGARMQEIADEAKINKALLHYYFRNKDMLFDRVFFESFKEFWPSIEAVASQTDISVCGLIRAIVNGYIDILEKMPFLPNFIFNEINREPERVEGLIRASGVKPEKIIAVFEKSFEKGEIQSFDPREVVINTIGLCVFPFLVRPLAERVFWSSSEAYGKFLKERRDSVYEFVCRSIMKKKVKKV